MLLEIDAQGSEGLSGLTKLRAEAIRTMRKVSNGYEEDQVDEHRGQKRARDLILLDGEKEQNEKFGTCLSSLKSKTKVATVS